MTAPALCCSRSGMHALMMRECEPVGVCACSLHPLLCAGRPDAAALCGLGGSAAGGAAAAGGGRSSGRPQHGGCLWQEGLSGMAAT